MHEFDKCIIETKGGTKLSQGYVRNFEGSVMKICLDNDASPVAPTLSVLIYIFNRVKGQCVYSGKVAVSEGKEVGIDKVKFIRSNQKRDNTRVDKTLRYNIVRRYISSSGLETEILEKPISIIILNISATGMFISCDEKFPVGFRFPLIFLEAGNPIDLQVEIVRADKRVRGNNYGCQFVNISQKDADNIFRFVLHEQIVQRRRKLIFR